MLVITYNTSLYHSSREVRVPSEAQGLTVQGVGILVSGSEDANRSSDKSSRDSTSPTTMYSEICQYDTLKVTLCLTLGKHYE